MFGLWINAQEAEKCSKIIATAQSHQIIVVKVMVVSTCIHRKFPVDEQITRCSRFSHWLKWQCLVTWVMRTSIAQRLNNYLWLMRERGRSMRWWKPKDTSTHSYFFASCAKAKPVCVERPLGFVFTSTLHRQIFVSLGEIRLNLLSFAQSEIKLYRVIVD